MTSGGNNFNDFFRESTYQISCATVVFIIRHHKKYFSQFFPGSILFEHFITQTTDKLFLFWMILSQFACCIETLWTFTANIRLHSSMALNVFFKPAFLSVQYIKMNHVGFRAHVKIASRFVSHFFWQTWHVNHPASTCQWIGRPSMRAATASNRSR